MVSAMETCQLRLSTDAQHTNIFAIGSSVVSKKHSFLGRFVD